MSCECDNQSADLFAQHNLRCTKQRKAIYSALTQTRCHPTADELYRQVQDQLPGVSLATVYNTLEAFNDAGLIAKLADAGLNGSARYDAHRQPHTHLRDRNTGRVADAPDDISQLILDNLPQEVLDTIRARMGFTVDEVQVELVGKFED
ncbi:MAG: Fur family transcriptional regulator [Phycisphaeraceae bacterium]